MKFQAVVSHFASIFALLPASAQAAAMFILVIAGGIVLQSVAIAILHRLALRWHPLLARAFIRTRTVARFALFVLGIALALPLVPLTPNVQDVMHRVLVALLIVLIGWAVMLAANLAIDRYMTHLKIDTADNLLARKAITQMKILRQALNVLVGLLTAGFALMTFDTVRQFGISLFASAGVAGVVAGLAARPLFSNLIAGVQLAITQPIRLDDAVVIQGEWGWVEEITSTYVVIRLWDWRRQIVPLTYFFENSFTNWTLSGSAIIGSVFLYLDFSAPVERIRRKAEELAKASMLWDGQVVNVQVSDAKERTIELRVLVSASDSSKTWDLRCEMREKLIAFILAECPGALPRARQEIDSVDVATDAHAAARRAAE